LAVSDVSHELPRRIRITGRRNGHYSTSSMSWKPRETGPYLHREAIALN
jgi:hypothetical protein